MVVFDCLQPWAIPHVRFRQGDPVGVAQAPSSQRLVSLVTGQGSDLHGSAELAKMLSDWELPILTVGR